MTIPVTYELKAADHVPVATHHLFDVLVYGANRMVLRPRSELAKSLAAMWTGMDVQISALWRGSAPNETDVFRYGGKLDEAEFRFRSRPMLAMGDDPFFTGMSLSAEDVAVARKAIEADRDRRRDRRNAAIQKIIKPSAKLDELQAAGFILDLVPAKKKRRSK
jgi:hypothetical protein